MKKVVFILSAISATPLLLAVALLSYVYIKEFSPPCIAPTTLHIIRMEWLISLEQMGGDEKLEEAFEKLRTCKKDKQTLARALLSNEDGTIVSLGMDLTVQESFENGEVVLTQYLDDPRWNFNLAFNSDYARFLLAVWRMDKNIPLTKEDEEAMQPWTEPYFERLGTNAPVSS